MMAQILTTSTRSTNIQITCEVLENREYLTPKYSSIRVKYSWVILEPAVPRSIKPWNTASITAPRSMKSWNTKVLEVLNAEILRVFKSLSSVGSLNTSQVDSIPEHRTPKYFRVQAVSKYSTPKYCQYRQNRKYRTQGQPECPVQIPLNLISFQAWCSCRVHYYYYYILLFIPCTEGARCYS